MRGVIRDGEARAAAGRAAYLAQKAQETADSAVAGSGVNNTSVNNAIAENPSASRGALGLGTAALAAAADFAAAAHGHAIADVSGLQAALAGKQPAGSYVLTVNFTWDNLGGKPATFPPSAHGHATSDVTGLDAALASKLALNANGKLLIGTGTETAAGIQGNLQVASEIFSGGSLAGLFWENRSAAATANSNWYGWYTSSGTIFLFNGSTNVASINATTGAYTALSDETLKTDIASASVGLKEILALRPVTYRMRDADPETPPDLGFLAQEVRDVLPAAYVENEDFIGLSDRPIIAALAGAIQELAAKVAELEAKLGTP